MHSRRASIKLSLSCGKAELRAINRRDADACRTTVASGYLGEEGVDGGEVVRGGGGQEGGGQEERLSGGEVFRGGGALTVVV